MKFFDVNSEKFEELLSFVLSEVKKRKETDKVDTVYIYSCYRKLIEKFDVYVREFDKFLPKFKFYELESITQSVLCLMKVENEVI
jgi:transcription termination factor NusB